VIGYLDRVDPEAAARARERYACFEHYNQDDARATEMGDRHGELNAGQLVRERYGRDAVNIGVPPMDGSTALIRRSAWPSGWTVVASA